ncbi:DUF1428 family protein [Rhodoblastus acidophilus]|uniref:DUF1428 family protein n=1 Tax=Rhodoblastus acidophilus TaxID=1074 RepID=A0A6N8DVY7_RHOAC|nr:DUF1428 family protein [Rhodoblastus acidophilus]MTV33343.1 DUF1428 family protein [Rhodoblastus acidophilus]
MSPPSVTKRGHLKSSRGSQARRKAFCGRAPYESRDKRDEVNARAMSDPRMTDIDGKRMIFGGFKSCVGD